MCFGFVIDDHDHFKNLISITEFYYFLTFFYRFSKLPVILKGIITHEDARLAVKTGCKGIIVSNHGARQLDTVPATIEALPEIVNAVGSQITVMIDGGIRNGI